MILSVSRFRSNRSVSHGNGWTPPGPGFYRITVLDADGVSARSELRVR